MYNKIKNGKSIKPENCVKHITILVNLIQITSLNYITGVHWLDEIITMLVNNTITLASGTKGQRTLEGITELSVLDSLPSPRILNTHLSFKYIPTKHVQNKGKIVHMIRNPKDICVSLYHHARRDVVMNYDVPWETYFENWVSGKGT